MTQPVPAHIVFDASEGIGNVLVRRFPFTLTSHRKAIQMTLDWYKAQYR